ncbi:MAG: DUF2157 domain-containing protein [Spirochaetales bacterium]|nr:DUF2157 domain-containing protein [Spirochaetales bacterium]
MNKKRFKWILREFEILKSEGVISSEVFADVQNYYQRKSESSDNKAKILTVFGILGGLLIGGGIILLLAHNWSSFSRIIQVSFFLAPLIAVQLISGGLLLKNNVRHIWYETIGIIYFLLIGAAVAMVSRIYHTGGELESFFLVWAIGGLPVLYLLKSDAAAVLYLAVITAWAAAAQSSGGSAVLYWPLFAAAALKLILSIRNSGSRYYRAFIEFLLIASVSASLGLSLEKVLPGMWILIYCSFFVLLFLAEGLYQGNRSRIPAAGISGTIGISAMAVLLTIDSLWEDVGFSFIREAHRFHQTAAAADYVVFGILVVLILFVILSRRVKLNRVNLMFSSILIPAAGGFLFPAYGAVFFHVFTLLFGYSLTIKEIIKDKQRFFADTGLVLLFLSMLIHLAIYDGFSAHWIFLYSCFLIVIFIKKGLFSGSCGFGTDKAWRAVCFISGILILYGLSFSRFDLPIFPDDELLSIGFLLSMIISGGAAAWYLIMLFKRERSSAIIISVFPVVVLLTIFTGMSGTLLYNLYLFAIGIAVVLKGISGKSMKTANAGIIISIALIITRFFDVDMSFTARGGAFILIGLLFVLFNVYFSRRLKREELK